MKKQIKLTEAELHNVIEGAVKNLLEYNGAEMAKNMKLYGRPSYDDDELDEFPNEFNEQPTNSVVGENKGQYKVTESQLHQIIKESVLNVLNEIGDTHRFGVGKYGLAMDAASKADSLGRKEQADNIRSHGANAFNKEYGTNGFKMNDLGKLRHTGSDGIEREYTPKNKLKDIERHINLQGGKERYDKALRDNAFIKNAARTAKAFPRKKMTGGLDAISKVDDGIHGNNI